MVLYTLCILMLSSLLLLLLSNFTVQVYVRTIYYNPPVRLPVGNACAHRLLFEVTLNLSRDGVNGLNKAWRGM